MSGIAVDRIACCVPFCRRTCKGGDGEWICGTHWMAVPARLRRRKYRFFRLYRRRYGDNFWGVYPPGSADRFGAVKLDRLCDKAWERCKRAAIELAAGI